MYKIWEYHNINRIVFYGLVAIVIFPPILFAPSSADSSHIKTTFLQFVILLSLFIYLLSVIGGGRLGLVIPTRDSLSLAIIVFSFLCVVSLFISKYKYASTEELIRYASYFGLYFLISKCVKAERQIDLLIGAIVFTTSVVSVYGLFQRAGYDFAHWSSTTKRILSTFGHPNFFAGYLVVVIPVLMVAFLVYSSWRKRLLVAATLVIAILCLLFTYSRGAFLGIIPALTCFGLFLLFYLKAGYIRKNSRRLACLMLLIAIPVTTTVVLDDRIAERASSALKMETEVTVSNQARLAIWSGAFSMFKAKPIFGWGLGTFQIYFPQFRPPDYRSKSVSHNTLHAHCEYLELAVELGIIGLGSFLAIIFLYFLRIHRALSILKEEKQKLLIVGFFCGTLGLLIHNLVSVNLRWSVPAVTFWLSLGLAMALANRQALAAPRVAQSYESAGREEGATTIGNSYSGFANRYAKAAMYLGLCLATLALLAIILFSFVSDFYSGLCSMNIDRGKKAEAARFAEKACYFDPYNLKAYYALGTVYLMQGHPEDAIRIYQHLAELAPNYAQIHYSLARAYRSLGEIDTAIEKVKKAVAFDDSPTIHVFLADLLAHKREWDQAEKELRRALQLDAKYMYAFSRLGDIYQNKEKYEKAIESYENALELRNDHVRSIFGIARCYEKQQKWKKAEEYFNQIIHRHPSGKYAEKAKERLDVLSNTTS